MVAAGVVSAGQTSSGAVTVVGAAVALALSTGRIPVEAAFTLVALSAVRVGDTRALPGTLVTERVPRTEIVTLAHCTHKHTDRQGRYVIDIWAPSHNFFVVVYALQTFPGQDILRNFYVHNV